MSTNNLKKTVTNTVKTQLEKNKPKLIKKTAGWIAEKVIGGPYLDAMVGAGKAAKKKYLPKLGKYAAKRFVNSSFAIDKLNSIPLFIFANVLRAILGFLIFNSLKTGIKTWDFGISVCITVISTSVSPIFYEMAGSQKEKFGVWTKYFINYFSRSTHHFYGETNMWSKTFVIVCIIIALEYIHIENRTIQEALFHSLIVNWVVYILTWLYKYKQSVRVKQLHYGMTCYWTPYYQLTRRNLVRLPERKIQYLNTNDLPPGFIEDYVPPQRAKKIKVIKDEMDKDIEELLYQHDIQFIDSY